MYLFDFDGTLVDSNGVWVEIDNGFLARRGLTPTREYSDTVGRSEEHTSELQSPMRISYAVFCLKKKFF